MKFPLFFFAALFTLLFASCSTQPGTSESGQSGLVYPDTRKDTTVTDDYFGTKVPDPYRWLEDENSPETSAWADAQNQLTESYLSAITYRDTLRKRLSEIWNYEKQSAPFHKAGKYFQYRNNGLQNQSVLYIMDQPETEGEILIDPNDFSKEGTSSLTDFSVSKDGKYAVYGVSEAGSDWKTFRVMDLPSKQVTGDVIRWIKFSGVAWQRNGFYYSMFEIPDTGKALTSKNLNNKLYYHQLGTSQQEDQVIFSDPANPKRSFYPVVTEDEKFLLISESETTSGNSLHIKDLSDPKSEIIRMTTGFDYDHSVIDHIDGKIYIRTNYNAPRYRVMVADPKKPELENWKELIPQKEEVLEGVHRIDGMLALEYMKDVTNRLYLHKLSGEFIREIALPGLGIVSSFSSRDTDTVGYFSYSTFTRPASIYKYYPKSDRTELVNAATVDFSSDDYTTSQIFYRSKDGTSIPMFITHKKGLQKNGNNPLLLYGYGGFNISITPSFRPDIAVFLENGGIYAVANIRGGGEYGKEWHDAGTLLKKQNVFDDFIAAAEYLINEGFTSREKIAITGRSNGGLLIGAVITQRPDLFRVAVPQVGVLDMLRYHQFTIGRAWAADYGLSEEKEHFGNLYRYSPLHNVKPADYPATMVMTGDHDDRVVPAHSYKFAATLQENQTGPEPVLIRIDRQAGHGAGKPVSKQIDEAADLWAFIFHNLEMKPNKR